MIISNNQYKNDMFQKLNFNFNAGMKGLDVGCGDGSDAEIFVNHYGLDVFGIDVNEEDFLEFNNFKYAKKSIYKLPFPDSFFDYVFLHDVLHHIDEPLQRKRFHEDGLKEVRRVCKSGGEIIIIEANRYNPFFFPHMTLMKKHDHFTQKYFTNLIKDLFTDDFIEFKFFEAHFYPKAFAKFFRFYGTIS